MELLIFEWSWGEWMKVGPKVADRMWSSWRFGENHLAPQVRSRTGDHLQGLPLFVTKRPLTVQMTGYLSDYSSPFPHFIFVKILKWIFLWKKKIMSIQRMFTALKTLMDEQWNMKTFWWNNIFVRVETLKRIRSLIFWYQRKQSIRILEMKMFLINPWNRIEFSWNVSCKSNRRGIYGRKATKWGWFDSR